MSRSSSAPPPSAKTELETVVNWPLLAGATGVLVAMLAVPLTLACIAALRGSAVKDPVVSLPVMPQNQAKSAAPTTTAIRPSLPPSVKQVAPEKTLPRQIYIKNSQPPIPPDPTAIPKV